MNQDCTTDTDSQMNMLMPMLMSDDNSTDDSLMMMMMMQSMGNNPVGMDMMMPFLMMDSDEEDSGLLTMVLMNSMTGGMNSQVWFFDDFNFLIEYKFSSIKISDWHDFLSTVLRELISHKLRQEWSRDRVFAAEQIFCWLQKLILFIKIYFKNLNSDRLKFKPIRIRKIDHIFHFVFSVDSENIFHYIIIIKFCVFSAYKNVKNVAHHWDSHWSKFQSIIIDYQLNLTLDTLFLVGISPYHRIFKQIFNKSIKFLKFIFLNFSKDSITILTCFCQC